MRTTLDVDPELLEQVERMTGEKSPSKAVAKALADYVRRKSVEELIAMAGKIEIADDWRELEELELKEMKHTEGNEW